MRAIHEYVTAYGREEDRARLEAAPCPPHAGPIEATLVGLWADWQMHNPAPDLRVLAAATRRSEAPPPSCTAATLRAI
jgi:hypothetical protein